LPDNLKPTLYDFTLKPYIGRNEAWSAEKDFTFEGIMNFNFVCAKPTNKIVLHSKDLDIFADRLEITSVDDPAMEISKNLEFDIRREFVSVTMSKACVQGNKYVLKMEYTGRLLPQLYGFYISSYIDFKGDRV
jgi:hypothetical protein